MNYLKSILFFFLFCNLAFGQGKLYVGQNRQPEFDVPGNQCRVDNYMERYNIGYDVGVHNIPNSGVFVELTFQEGYNDDPGYGCNGPCGQFGWRPTLNRSTWLYYLQNISINYNGPNPVTCPVDDTFPLDYNAIFMPDMEVVSDVNTCGPLFEEINTPTQNLQALGIQWEYRDLSGQWQVLPNYAYEFPLTRSIVDIFGSNYTDTIGDSVLFLKYTVFQRQFESERYDISIIDCSIEHSSLTTEDETCAGSGDGKIRLGFEDDVEEGYFMRYYIYQGNADDFVGNVTDSIPASPMDVYEDVNFRTSAGSGNNLGPLQLNPDTGEYEGEYSLLEGSNEGSPIAGQPYYIVYQEVRQVNGQDYLDVKSGNITETFYIRAPSALSVSTPVITQPECAGDTGTIGFNVSGGGYANTDAARYYYSVASGGGFVDWTESTTGAISIPNLNAGTYNIKVVAGNSSLANTDGCHVTLSDLTIAAPVPLGFDLSSSPESYPGANDGTVSVSNITVRTGMTLSINTNPVVEIDVDNPINSTPLFRDLPSGTYAVTLSAGTCTYTESIEVTVVTLPVITVNSTTADDCDPAGAGSVDFNISGGVGDRPYRVLASDGTTVIANGTATDANVITVNDLVFDTYTIQAVNQGNDFGNPNLISSAEFTIDSGANIEISNVATTVINCFGGTSTLTFDTNLGTAAEYYLDTQANPDLTTVTWTGYDVAGQPGLTAGTYYLWVRSTTDTSCIERYDGGVIQIVSPTALAYTPTVIDNTEEGGTAGQIDLGPITGGTAPYTITWVSGPAGFDPVIAGNSPVIAGLSSGLYTVGVTDANGCEMAMDIEVRDPILRIVGTAVLDERCFGAGDGSIQVNYTGLGTVTLDYTGPESGSLDGTGQNSLVLQDLAPGEYTLTLGNDRGEADQTATVTVGGSPSLFELAGNHTVSPVSCIGASDGVLTLTLTGGWGDYRYSLDGAANASSAGGTLTFTNLTVGTHSLFVTDRASNGCSYAIDFEVDEPEPIMATASVVGLSSFGADDGTIRITEITGGTLNGADTYQLAWSGIGAVTTTDNGWTAVDLAQGNYSVRITDGNGCFATFDYVVTEPGELAVTLTADGEVSCYGERTVTLISTIVGGTPGYAYQWYQEEGGSYRAIADATEADLFDVGAGNYRLEVTDRDGAGVGATAELTITQPEALTITLEGITDIECNGAASGGATVTVSGGTGDYEYAWYDAGFNVVATTPNLANAPSGTYSLEVVDGNSCFTTLTDITLVDLFAPLAISESTVTNVSAYQGADGSIGITVVGGRPDYTISWEDQTGAIVGSSASIANVMAGNYRVTITDSNGCEATEVYEVTQPDIIEATIDHPRCFGNADGSIGLEVNKGNGSFTYQWNTGATTAELTGLSAGFYTVTISGFASGTETRTYELVNPPLLTVDLGQDVVLCRDQGVRYDIGTEAEGATYQWTSDTGFSSSSPIVDLDRAGTYTATVSTPLGCTASGTVTITTVAQDISAELALSTQAFTDESIMAVDISYPLPDRVEWILPEGAELLEQDQDQVAFLFQEPGEYEIGLVTYRGPCTASQYKTILVLEKDQTVSGAGTDGYQKRVDEFLAYPNPTSGNFTVEVGLTEVANVSVKVFNLSNNRIIAAQKEGGEDHYRMAMDISQEPAGIYAVLIETPYGKYLRKVIKN
ncbi:T9SS type A sorting domain-containing protein [Croceivirga radicis]|uniref:T9SS type A sorting domain-containing protein n=1 Tax=Croceivirga radicis TaxID=1929488 RepID=UPI0009B20E28|nr:T9SS type A sorting domain-containing protein [Croceivirga radicis]